MVQFSFLIAIAVGLESIRMLVRPQMVVRIYQIEENVAPASSLFICFLLFLIFLGLFQTPSKIYVDLMG